MDWIYISAFIQSALQFMPLIHTFTVTFKHQQWLTGMQGTNQCWRSNWGLGVFLRDTDTPRVGSNRQPSDCQPTAHTSWAISPPQHWCIKGSVLRPVCPGPSVMLWVPFVSRLSAVLCSSPCFLSCPGFWLFSRAPSLANCFHLR